MESYNDYFESLYGKRVAVVGMGVSNQPLVEELIRFKVDVTVCDKRGENELRNSLPQNIADALKFKCGEDYLTDLDFDVIFRTPGLHPFILRKGIIGNPVVTSEMEAFFQLCPCRIIAVTGSDGKTTTTTLISEILKKAGYTVHLGGNIGKPLLTDVPNMGKDDFAVLELSSFQLHSMKCAPDVAVVTNISPNHLDVHPDYQDYIDAKKSVFTGQSRKGVLVLNKDNEITAAFASAAPGTVRFFSRREKINEGAYCLNQDLVLNGKTVISRDRIILPGDHNVENLLAAFAATKDFVSIEDMVKVAESFPGVPHRIELIREKDGVKFYNDSIASSPTRAVAGLRSFHQKVIMIAGGHDKHVPFDELALVMQEKVKALYLTGETAEIIRNSVVNAPGYSSDLFPVFIIDDFTEAVKSAASYAVQGDIVILCPACSSFDKFKNFVERGNTFKNIIFSL